MTCQGMTTTGGGGVGGEKTPRRSLTNTSGQTTMKLVDKLCIEVYTPNQDTRPDLAYEMRRIVPGMGGYINDHIMILKVVSVGYNTRLCLSRYDCTGGLMNKPITHGQVYCHHRV